MILLFRLSGYMGAVGIGWPAQIIMMGAGWFFLLILIDRKE